MLDDWAAALSFALAASADRCSALTLSSSAFCLFLCSILLFFRLAPRSRTLFFRYSVSSCVLFIYWCFNNGPTDEIFLKKIVCDQGFICDRDYFINRDHAYDWDVFFGIGEVEHKGNFIKHVCLFCKVLQEKTTVLCVVSWSSGAQWSAAEPQQTAEKMVGLEPRLWITYFRQWQKWTKQQGGGRESLNISNPPLGEAVFKTTPEDRVC